MRNFLAALVVCTSLLAPVAAIAADRGPETPAERKQALEYIQHFEDNPLNPALKPETRWVITWMMDVPDVHVNLCTIVTLPKGDKNHGQTLFTAMLLAAIAFVLQHPEKENDLLGQYQAGVEGALRAYEKLLRANPKDRQPNLDDLIERRGAGTLTQFVEESAAATCKP